MADQYSYCESLAASGSSPWHIRKLSAGGQKLSGRVDTPSLCGRAMAWDINHPIGAHDEFPCKKCLEDWRARNQK